MAKYIVETYYTCTFKVKHFLDDISSNQLDQLDKRDDGEFEILDVKFDKRNTKNLEKNTGEVEVKFNESKADINNKKHIDNSKNVSLTDPATIAKQIDNKFKEVTGRGATDEDVRAFTELFYDLQREATPTVKEVRERAEGQTMGQERLGTLDLTARAEQYAKEQAPVEAGAMQTANKAGLIMQALGFGG